VDFEGRARLDAVFCPGCPFMDDHGQVLYNKYKKKKISNFNSLIIVMEQWFPVL